MAKAPDERVGKAKELFSQGMKLIEIAKTLNVSEGTVRSWKSRYKWDNATLQNKKRNVAKTRGGQPGNKNAVGGGAPLKNNNAEKFGFFRKYLPEETVSIIEEMPKDPLDILWDQIQIAYAAIIRAQKIMYVEDKHDKTKDIVSEGECSTAWEVQQAWDKQSNFLQAQARAQKTLEGLINKYEDLLHKDWDKASEEQKLRIEVLKAKAQLDADEQDEDDGFLEALNGSAKEDWSDEEEV